MTLFTIIFFVGFVWMIGLFGVLVWSGVIIGIAVIRSGGMNNIFNDFLFFIVLGWHLLVVVLFHWLICVVWVVAWWIWRWSFRIIIDLWIIAFYWVLWIILWVIIFFIILSLWFRTASRLRDVIVFIVILRLWYEDIIYFVTLCVTHL